MLSGSHRVNTKNKRENVESNEIGPLKANPSAPYIYIMNVERTVSETVRVHTKQNNRLCFLFVHVHFCVHKQKDTIAYLRLFSVYVSSFCAISQSILAATKTKHQPEPSQTFSKVIYSMKKKINTK